MQTGTYILYMRAEKQKIIPVGKLGRLKIAKGDFIYLGSAFGPGGVPARIRHHLRIASSPHWHMDYLRPFMSIVKIWYTNDIIHREHQWASVFSAMADIRIPLKGFGASDCRCDSHLFFLEKPFSLNCFRQLIRAKHPDHLPIKPLDMKHY